MEINVVQTIVFHGSIVSLCRIWAIRSNSNTIKVQEGCERKECAIYLVNQPERRSLGEKFATGQRASTRAMNHLTPALRRHRLCRVNFTAMEEFTIKSYFLYESSAHLNCAIFLYELVYTTYSE